MSLLLSDDTEDISWTKPHAVEVSAIHIPGEENIMEDQLSHHDQVILTEWSPLP